MSFMDRLRQIDGNRKAVESRRDMVRREAENRQRSAEEEYRHKREAEYQQINAMVTAVLNDVGESTWGKYNCGTHGVSHELKPIRYHSIGRNVSYYWRVSGGYEANYSYVVYLTEGLFGKSLIVEYSNGHFSAARNRDALEVVFLTAARSGPKKEHSCYDGQGDLRRGG